MSLKKFDLLNDIYYFREYVLLYLNEKEELFEFEYKVDDNIFYTISIKRPIKIVGNLNVNEEYYDLETAYGYGGFYTNTESKVFLKEAVKVYEQKCINERIVAEFVRFHPFNDFPSKHSEFLDFNIYDRDVVVKPLVVDIMGSYKAKVRNLVKRSNEKVIISESEDIDRFIELYNKTMDKNSATDFYFFDKKYYIDLLNSPNIKLYKAVYNCEIIAMGFFMYGKDIVHYHLSANSDISYKINANYALLNYAFNQAQKLNKTYFLLGGGTTSLEDDSLLKFKQKFSKETKQFFISGKIYNKEIYNKYVRLWEEQSEEDIKYLLKYRLEIK